MEVTAELWDAAKAEPQGTEMSRLTYLVISHLKAQSPNDARWAGHGKASLGCRLRGLGNHPTCRCAIFRSVRELAKKILSTEARPSWDEESEEPTQRGHLEQVSQTESDQEDPEAAQIESSSAKKFKRPTQKNAPPSQNKRTQKQKSKQDQQQARRVHFSNQQVLVDSNNKAHHLQLQDPEGDQMTFGKERNGEPEQLLSITATTANTSGGNL